MAPKRLDMLNDSFQRVMSYSLQTPDYSSFQTYFPNLPSPVVEALLDLYRQVLLHVEINSKAEFADICGEYAIQQQLAEIERVCAAAPMLSQGSATAPAAHAAAAELHASISTKQMEIAHLQLELARARGERDALKVAKEQRQAQVEQLAAGYQAVAGSLKMVYDATACGQQQPQQAH